MFCKHCGYQLPEDSNFCPNCGKITDEVKKEEEKVEETVEVIDCTNVDPFLEEQKDELGGKILKFSILGLAFSFFLPILGFIFTIIAKSKIRSYVNLFGETQGRASVGKGLSIGGLISSIVFFVIWTLYIILLVISFILMNAEFDFVM